MKAEFEEYLADRANAVTPSTIDVYRTNMANFIRWTEVRGVALKSLGSEHIAQWVRQAQSDGYNTGVIVSWVGQIKTFLAWATRHRKLRAPNPVDRRQLPRLVVMKSRKAPFTLDTYRAILAHATSLGPKFDFWPDAIAVAWHTGLRMSDVALLPWSAVNLPERLLRATPKKMARSGQVLEIPINAELAEMLARLPDDGRGYVLPKFHYEYEYNRAALSNEFSVMCQACGLGGLTFHSLRHGFVTRLFNADVNPILISSMTGQSLKTLSGYAHPSLEAKRRALESAERKVA